MLCAFIVSSWPIQYIFGSIPWMGDRLIAWPLSAQDNAGKRGKIHTFKTGVDSYMKMEMFWCFRVIRVVGDLNCLFRNLPLDDDERPTH